MLTREGLEAQAALTPLLKAGQEVVTPAEEKLFEAVTEALRGRPGTSSLTHRDLLTFLD